jgi:hypothetical protein
LSANHPEHWNLLQGTANWFQLWHPPNWTPAERSGAVTLQLPGDGFLAIHSFLSSETADGHVAPPDLMNVARLFPRVRDVRRLHDDHLEFLNDSMQGLADLKTEPKWWKRLLRRPDWRRWSMWAFNRGGIYVVATLVHGPQYDPELQSLVRMSLATLELPSIPAAAPDAFSLKVLELARRKFPLLECQQGDGFQIQIGASSVNLFNLYRSYVKAPDRFEEMLLPALTTAVQVQEWDDGRAEPPLDAVRDRIMPMLYPESIWQRRFPAMIGTPWVAGLAILYVVDEAHAYWYLRNAHRDHWGLEVDDIHTIAMTNLERHFDQKPMEIAVAESDEDSPAVLLPSQSDAYNSSRLLSEPFLARLLEVIGENFAIGLPSRDFFVAVKGSLPQTIEQIRRRVRIDFGKTEYPLTDRLLLVSADGVSELTADVAGMGPVDE